MISEHIQLLLHRNDCVVVPGLGGFILNHLTAGYDEKEGRYYPSHSLPFFNKQLQSNDGLLAASLVKKNGMDYSAALTEIKRFVEQVNDTLADNREYVLQGMGTFQKNHENQITFHPDTECNLFIDSYGLSSLEMSPMLKPAEISRKALAPVRKKSRTWMSMAACLLILAGGGWWLNYSVQSPFGNQWSALNPLEWDWNTEKQTPAAPKTEPVQDETTFVEEEYQESTLPDTSNRPEEVVEATPVPVTDSVYYIVVGAFRNERNALRYEQELKTDGFSALHYEGPDSELIRVCAEQHTIRFEAEERLPFIKESAHPKAWILAIAKDRSH